jgi:rfaE bifunctional protein nucleotidyltransferase chain/domain
MVYLKLKDLKPIIDKYSKRGKKIVFTNGCFDILHIGHVRYLEEAKRLGDILIVGINSDNSVRELKGKGRPFIPVEERAEIVSSLKSVDYVVTFNETDPERLIKQIRPDIHVKGGDYTMSEIPEAELVKSLGGKVVILEEVKERSTSNIYRKITSNFERSC